MGVQSVGFPNQNELATNSGAAYVYGRSPGVLGTWSYKAYLKASNPGGGINGQTGDHFGSSVAVSVERVVVGAYNEDSSLTGGIPNESKTNSGAAYVFKRNLPGPLPWTQETYLKASNIDIGDQFGFSVAVSGCTVIVGANLEDSSVNSPPNNLSINSGAAYYYGCADCGNPFNGNPPMLITSGDEDTAFVNKPFSYAITTTEEPTSYAAADLPPGLSLDAVTGEISGTPTTVGTYTIMLSSSNDNGTGNQTLTLSVTLPLEIRITYYVDLPGFVLSVQGEENQEYVVEYTTDFQEWIPLEFEILGETDLFMVDPQAMDSPYRFYRVIKR